MSQQSAPSSTSEWGVLWWWPQYVCWWLFSSTSSMFVDEIFIPRVESSSCKNVWNLISLTTYFRLLLLNALDYRKKGVLLRWKWYFMKCCLKCDTVFIWLWEFPKTCPFYIRVEEVIKKQFKYPKMTRVLNYPQLSVEIWVWNFTLCKNVGSSPQQNDVQLIFLPHQPATAFC